MCIRVFLVDDCEVFRWGLRTILERTGDFAVVGEADEALYALEQIQALQPIITILDCKLRNSSTVRLAQKIKHLNRDAHLLVLSSYADDYHVQGMLAAGVSGYMMKEADSEQIVTAVHAVSRGEHYFSSIIADKALALRKDGNEPIPLTSQEIKVLRQVAEGKSNHQIATALALKERTIETHLTNVFHKLKVGSRVQAVLWFHEQVMTEFAVGRISQQ